MKMPSGEGDESGLDSNASDYSDKLRKKKEKDAVEAAR
jgi:hypothetical protein